MNFEDTKKRLESLGFESWDGQYMISYDATSEEEIKNITSIFDEIKGIEIYISDPSYSTEEENDPWWVIDIIAITNDIDIDALESVF